MTEGIPLATCVRNLVDNASKHHPGPSGRVLVSYRRDGDRLLIKVGDDGQGIAEKDHGMIFEPLRGSGPAGTGFGLAVVRRILHERGGNISVTSAIGDGTTFHVEWPLSRATEIQDSLVLET